MHGAHGGVLALHHTHAVGFFDLLGQHVRSSLPQARQRTPEPLQLLPLVVGDRRDARARIHLRGDKARRAHHVVECLR